MLDGTCVMLSEVVEWKGRLRPREEGSMSVLIKGMEMPKSCTLCELLYNDGRVFYCPLQSKEANLKAYLLIELYENCPLVEVPPHGRLIDADALNKAIRTDIMGGLNYEYFIETAPTIIESEGEDG